MLLVTLCSAQVDMDWRTLRERADDSPLPLIVSD